MKLTEQPKLAAFLGTEMVATVALPIDANGGIHAASLLYTHTTEPLAFYFITGHDSEKCRLLRSGNAVRGACVIGTYKGTPFTLQMRGKFRVADPQSYQAQINRYYQKHPKRQDDINDSSNVLLIFTPDWARFTDYAHGWNHHFLDVGQREK